MYIDHHLCTPMLLLVSSVPCHYRGPCTEYELAPPGHVCVCVTCDMGVYTARHTHTYMCVCVYKCTSLLTAGHFFVLNIGPLFLAIKSGATMPVQSLSGSSPEPGYIARVQLRGGVNTATASLRTLHYTHTQTDTHCARCPAGLKAYRLISVIEGGGWMGSHCARLTTHTLC